MQYIYVQRPCRYCGAEVGAWCQTSRNEPAYDVHSVRHNEVAAMVRKLPIDVFPEWTKHWSTAEGCDPDAVMRVLSALRREGLIPGDPPEEPSLELEVTGWVQPEPGQSSADPSED